MQVIVDVTMTMLMIRSSSESGFRGRQTVAPSYESRWWHKL